MIYVTFVLDETGSMAGSVRITMSRFNEYIDELKQTKESEKVRFSLLRFNSGKMEYQYEKAKLEDVKELTDYTPSNGTPLYDAIGNAISSVPGDAKESVLVVLTDGHENSSKEYTHENIKDLLNEKRKLGWETIFLAAGIDMVEARRISTQGNNLDFDHVISTDKSADGFFKSYRIATDISTKYLEKNSEEKKENQ